MLLVSHDRRLLERICTELWIVSDGRVVRFDGGWRAWRAAVANGWTAAAADDVAATGRSGIKTPKGATGAPAAVKPVVKKAVTAAPVTPVAKLSKEQARRRRAAVEADLERYGLKKSQLELALLDPQVLASYTDLARVSSELADVAAALLTAEEAWLALEGEGAR